MYHGLCSNLIAAESMAAPTADLWLLNPFCTLNSIVPCHEPSPAMGPGLTGMQLSTGQPQLPQQQRQQPAAAAGAHENDGAAHAPLLHALQQVVQVHLLHLGGDKDVFLRWMDRGWGRLGAVGGGWRGLARWRLRPVGGGLGRLMGVGWWLVVGCWHHRCGGG